MFRLIKKFLKSNQSDNENIELIRNSKYFDEKYYKLENPNVKGDLCKHYYYYGWKEGKSPSYEFSNNFYLKNYKDVDDAGINPLVHYLLSGKAENRMIEKDNGLSLKKVYEKVYGCPYFYKTYVYNTSLKRVNLFFDKLDSKVNDMTSLFKFIVKYCKDNDYNLRIIYYKADFEVLKEFLSNNKIILPKDTVFLNLKSSNYLEVGLEEKYVCTSWKNARALLNTASMNTNIYYYVSSIDNLSNAEYYQVSNICCNSQVVCLVDDSKVLKNLKQCKLEFLTNKKKFIEGDMNQLYCDFNDMFIVGVELLNDAFLTGELDASNWMVNIVSYDNDFKFHFDTNVRIRKVDKIEEYADFVFKVSYDKEDMIDDVSTVVAVVSRSAISKKEVIVIEDSKEFKFNNEKVKNTYIENYFKEFKRALREVKEDKDV